MSKSKFTVKRMEEMEEVIRNRDYSYYYPTGTHDHDYKLELFILQRAIYYLELGLTPLQVKKGKHESN